MNVYSELLELLAPKTQPPASVLLGTIKAVSPLTLHVRGADLTEGLFYPRGTVFYPEHIGREVALLPFEAGFLILFQVEGDSL